MKMAFWQRLAVLTLLGWGISSFSHSGQAAQFEHHEIEQDDFIILAAPGGDIGYKLLILEQLDDSRPCWTETGSNPSTVEPLLLSFDFTGICNRLVDSNGFSMRTAGQDHGLQYSLRVLKKDAELVLVAASNTERDTQIEIGRTYGLPTGFSRIVLDPGWRLTRRAFNGRAIGHVYLTYDQPIDVLVAASGRNSTYGSRPSINRPPTLPTPIPVDPQPDASEPSAGVIPVPSLPPADVNPTATAPLPAPLPPLSTRPAPLPAQPSQTAPTAPSLSSILPPPPPAPPDSAPVLVPPPTLDQDNQSVTLPAPTAETATDTETNSESDSTETTSNPPTRRTPAASPEPANPAEPAETVAQAGTYQVVVVADSAEVQDQVRALAPNAFLTTINGQVVMQVGVFRERREADRLQQKMSLEGLPTAVIPVR